MGRLGSVPVRSLRRCCRPRVQEPPPSRRLRMSTRTPLRLSGRWQPSPSPHSWDLCDTHGSRITAPQGGWELVRHEGGFASSTPDEDDLTALAEAVREAGLGDRSKSNVDADEDIRPAAPSTARTGVVDTYAFCPTRPTDARFVAVDARLDRVLPHPSTANLRTPCARTFPSVRVHAQGEFSVGRTAESVAAIIKAYDVRGVVGEQIDEDFVRDVGASFARLVRDEAGAATTVVIGYDMRASSPTLSSAFGDGVLAQGLDVVYIGLASTDELYFASGLLNCPGAMFTASHNPAKYNGIKMCRAGAKPVGQDTGLAVISAEVVSGVPAYDGPAGTASTKDVLEEYASYLRGLVDLAALRPLKVAVDAGNGMGGHTAPAVFGPMPPRRPAAVLRARRHVPPQPRSQSARSGQPRRPAGLRARNRSGHRLGVRR